MGRGGASRRVGRLDAAREIVHTDGSRTENTRLVFDHMPLQPACVLMSPVLAPGAHTAHSRPDPQSLPQPQCAPVSTCACAQGFFRVARALLRWTDRRV